MPHFSLRRREPSIITRADRAREAGQWQLAAGLYRIALERNPKNLPIWTQYGHALKEAGDLAGSEAAYRTALGYNPRHADCHLHLGHVLKIQGKIADARAAYLRALEIEPGLSDAAGELARLAQNGCRLSEDGRPIVGDGIVGWPYRADLPQRYAINYGRYVAAGGLVRPDDDVKPFVAGGHDGDMGRFYFFCLALDQIAKEGLEGDIAELGVYKGHTAALLANIARRLDRNTYLFDTFEGFPQSDLHGVDADKAFEFGDTSLEAVRMLVGEENVRFIKGYFPDSLVEMSNTARFCLVHIDCDLYAPASSALDYFYPRLVPGGFMIVHDYSSLHWDGMERAVDEFFADKPECVVPLSDGAGSAVIRKARVPGGKSNWLLQSRIQQVGEEWASAARGYLRSILSSGWSNQEDWGVWGVGDRHEINIYIPEPCTGDLEIEADVQVALRGPDACQPVDVFVDGDKLAVWEFTGSMNRGVRTVNIPAACFGARPPRVPYVTLSFRPHYVVKAIEIDPTTHDDRALGLALHRIRKRVVNPRAKAALRSIRV